MVVRRSAVASVSAVLAAGLTITAAAAIVGCSRQTASKWVGRARRGEGLQDRSSRPHRSPRRTPVALEQAVLRARRELRLGPHPLAWKLGLAPSTVHAILARHGRSRLRERATRAPALRYERSRPGELVHIDVKPLGRIRRRHDPVTGRLLGKKGRSGRVFCFVGVDDCSRLADARLDGEETTASATAFLAACRRFYARGGITIERVLTDNGKCFKQAWERACGMRAITPRRTRPRRPQTNGKVERLIRTLAEGWAYGFAYGSEAERARALARYLDYYDCRRRHRALGGQTPLQRVNDLSGTNTPGSPMAPSSRGVGGARCWRSRRYARWFARFLRGEPPGGQSPPPATDRGRSRAVFRKWSAPLRRRLCPGNKAMREATLATCRAIAGSSYSAAC